MKPRPRMAEMRARVHWDDARARNLPDRAPGFVYFIGGHEVGPIKIGYAKRPRDRVLELQCGNPIELELIACFPGNRQDEGRLHVAMKDHFVRGEWFERDAVLALLDAGEMQFRCTVGSEIANSRLIA